MRRRNLIFFSPVLAGTSAKSRPRLWPMAGGRGVAMLTSLGGWALKAAHALHIWQCTSTSAAMSGHQ